MFSHVCAGNADRLAKIALDNGLFAFDGTMKYLFEEALEKPDQFAVSLAYIDDTPVGAAIAVRETGELNAYVNPGHRGDGVGQKLVAGLCATSGMTRQFLFAQHGRDEEQSLKFWRKCKIYVPPDKFILSQDLRSMVVDSENKELELRRKLATLYVFDLYEQGLNQHVIVSELVSEAQMEIVGYTDRPEYRALWSQ